MDMVTVKVKAPHGNALGATYEKAVGDVYDCPADTAASLAREGLIEPLPPAAPALAKGAKD